MFFYTVFTNDPKLIENVINTYGCDPIQTVQQTLIVESGARYIRLNLTVAENNIERFVYA